MQLPLVGAPEASLRRLFYLVGERLCGIRPSNWLDGLTLKVIFVLLNRLANSLGLELLEL